MKINKYSLTFTIFSIILITFIIYNTLCSKKNIEPYSNISSTPTLLTDDKYYTSTPDLWDKNKTKPLIGGQKFYNVNITIKDGDALVDSVESPGSSIAGAHAGAHAGAGAGAGADTGPDTGPGAHAGAGAGAHAGAGADTGPGADTGSIKPMDFGNFSNLVKCKNLEGATVCEGEACKNYVPTEVITCKSQSDESTTSSNQYDCDRNDKGDCINKYEIARKEAERLAEIERKIKQEAEILAQKEKAAKNEAERLAAKKEKEQKEAQAREAENKRRAAEEAAAKQKAEEAARVEAARVEAARVEAARIEAARVEAVRVEAARVEAVRVEAARVEAARVEQQRLAEPKINCKGEWIKTTDCSSDCKGGFLKEIYKIITKPSINGEKCPVSENSKRNSNQPCNDHLLCSGKYKIKTTSHGPGKQPAGWGLSAWNAHGAKRNDSSSWIAVHQGDHWPMIWDVTKNNNNTYNIKTTSHGPGKQPAGWGLSAWNAHGAKRNNSSSRVAVHSGDYWPMKWNIIPGNKKDTWRINTTAHGPGKQPAGWGLSAWHAHGAKRNGSSSWVNVHSGDYWPMNWKFIKV